MAEASRWESAKEIIDGKPNLEGLVIVAKTGLIMFYASVFICALVRQAAYLAPCRSTELV